MNEFPAENERDCAEHFGDVDLRGKRELWRGNFGIMSDGEAGKWREATPDKCPEASMNRRASNCIERFCYPVFYLNGD